MRKWEFFEWGSRNAEVGKKGDGKGLNSECASGKVRKNAEVGMRKSEKNEGEKVGGKEAWKLGGKEAWKLGGKEAWKPGGYKAGNRI